MLKPLVLIVLDGWGLGKTEKGNAIARAQTPVIDKLNAFYPHIALQTSGISVGLPWGEAGNSEVGHMTLGAGKIIYQNMPRITMEIQNGEFFRNEILMETMERAAKNNSALHLMGLIGQGSVHSYLDHLYALLEFARNQKLENVFVHIFTDGRDSPPMAAVEAIMELRKKMQLYRTGKIASICGRYFAMDRNNNWDRTEKAYRLIVSGEGNKIADPVQYLQESYGRKVFDEYIEPATVCSIDSPPVTVKSGDSVIFFNFREDRARQLTKAFVLPGFSKFERKMIENIYFTTLTQYEDNLPVKVVYPPVSIKESLGSVLSRSHIRQLRIAETEKFAHVTYFFNGGAEDPFPLEDRVIIPSKITDSFDKIPGMSAAEITEAIIKAVNSDKYDFILVNYANADIVGHTGNEEATIQAVQEIDKSLGTLIPAVLLKGGGLLITADHGNAEELKRIMTGEIETEHSTNPVPLWFVTPENHREAPDPQFTKTEAESEGLLSDIAPTVLELLELPKSAEMTGESLLPLLK